MRRWWWIGAGVLGLAALLIGLSLFRTHQEIQAVGVEVYQEMEGDGLPPPAGVLDDPVFGALPPPDHPVSLGRYKPAAQPPAQKAAQPPPARPSTAVQTPTPAPSTPPAGDTPEPARPAAPDPAPSPTPPPAKAPPTTPPAPARPLTFTERLSTGQKIHVLLIGTDQETLKGGRADVLLVLTFDPAARRLSLLSLPRDTRVNLPERGPVKINAAYDYGGASLQTVAVERFLGIPMDKVVAVSLGGFRDAIDAVGGVTVHPTFGFSLDGETFQPGEMHLNGTQALAYARMRKQDPRGDLGRNERQQEVVRSLMGALGGLSSSELTGVLHRVEGNLRTNFSPSEVVRLRTTQPYLLDRQQVVRVQGVGRMVGRVWYYLVSDVERRRLHLLLR